MTDKERQLALMGIPSRRYSPEVNACLKALTKAKSRQGRQATLRERVQSNKMTLQDFAAAIQKEKGS